MVPPSQNHRSSRGRNPQNLPNPRQHLLQRPIVIIVKIIQIVPLAIRKIAPLPLGVLPLARLREREGPSRFGLGG